MFITKPPRKNFSRDKLNGCMYKYLLLKTFLAFSFNTLYHYKAPDISRKNSTSANMRLLQFSLDPVVSHPPSLSLSLSLSLWFGVVEG